MLVVVRDDADVPGQEEQEQPHQDQAARQDHQLSLLAATHFLALCPLSLEGQIKARRVSALSSPELSQASMLFESILRPILPSWQNARTEFMKISCAEREPANATLDAQ